MKLFDSHQEFIGKVKELIQYSKSSTYNDFKQERFLANIEQFLNLFFLPFAVLTLIMTWTFFFIKAQNKYLMFIELLIEFFFSGLIYLISYLIIGSLKLNAKNKQIYMIIVIFLFQQFCVFFLFQINYDRLFNEFISWDAILIGSIVSIFVNIYPFFWIKLLILLLQILEIILFLDKTQILNQLLYIFLIIISLSFISLFYEIMKLEQYKMLVAYIGLIEISNDGICLVNPSKKEVLYSNKNFDNFEEKFQDLIGIANGEQKSMSRNKFLILEKLKITKIKNYNIIFDEMEKKNENNECFKVKAINFEGTDFLRIDEQVRLSYNQQNQVKLANQINKLRSNLNETTIHKTFYLSDIEIKYEIDQEKLFKAKIQQFKIQQSEKFLSFSPKMPTPSFSQSKKRQQVGKRTFKSVGNQNRRKKLKNLNFLTKLKSLDQYQDDLNQNQQESESPHFLQYQLDKSKSFEQTNILKNKKIRFFIKQIQNLQFFGENNNLEIFTISDLTSIESDSKIKILEEYLQNILQTISIEVFISLQNVLSKLMKVSTKKKIIDQLDLGIINQIQRSIQLSIFKIQNLLDYREIISNNFHINKEQINLIESINYCISLFQEQIEMNKQNLILNLPTRKGQSIYVIANKDKFYQLMSNLLSNAIKFTRSKGTITINICEATQISIIDPQQLQQFKYLDTQLFTITVFDTGIGMTESQLLSIRNQLENKNMTDQGSIGIGLTCCKQIISMIGPEGFNTLQVESKLFEGSSFTFYVKEFENQFGVVDEDMLQNSSSYLMDSIERQSQNPVYELPQKFEFQSPRNDFENLLVDQCQCNQVLIIAKDKTISESLQNIIIKQGFTVEYCSNEENVIRESMERRKSNQCGPNCHLYFCVFIDFDGINSDKQIEQLKESIEIDQIKIIALRDNDQQKRKSSLEYGNQKNITILQKPINQIMIKEVIQKLMKKVS